MNESNQSRSDWTQWTTNSTGFLSASPDRIYRFDVDPFQKERARIANRGSRSFAYTPKRTRVYENLIAAIARQTNQCNRWDVMTAPISVQVVFKIRRPKSVTRMFHTVKPDLSNLIKAIEDACNGIIWKDDSQIVSILAAKQYDECPGIVLRVFSG